MTAPATQPSRPDVRATDRWSTAWAFTLSALFLSFAIQLNFGRLTTGAILLVTLALAACVIGVIGPEWSAIRERNIVFALGTSLLVEIGLMLVWPPGAGSALQDAKTLLPFRIAMAASGAAGLWALTTPRRTSLGTSIVLVIYLMVGAWVIALSPSPTNHVWHFQQAAGGTLLAGKDPYAMSMPNIYGPRSGLYAPSLEHGPVLNFGFLYPPLSLFLALPGIVVGDVRWALLLASAAAGILVLRSQPGRVAIGAGLLLFFTPRTFFIIEQGWTEPFAVMLLALVVFLAGRASRLTPVGLGMLAAVKQDIVLALPLSVLLLPRGIEWRRLIRPASVTAGVILGVTLPLAIWNAGSFWHSVVVVQFLQPARTDALAYPAWLVPQLPSVSAAAGFLVLIPATALIVWRSARTPAGFAGATAFAYLAFFAFSKQAFANYYYLVIGALCSAIAARADTRAPEASR